MAVAMGILIVVLGGSYYGLLFLFDLLLFLVLSAVVTRIGRISKQGIGVYEAGRGWKNVLANGAVPVVVVATYWLNLTYQFLPTYALVMAYIASVCAIIADKFASEIGVLDGEPTMLLTFKKTKKGVSGGVTGIGLLASLIGSAIIGISVFAVPGGSILVAAIVVLCGFLGNLVDSVFGYYEEEGVGNKFTSNFFCSVAGFLICLLLLIALGLA